jgi:ABC-2 type transport system ATP-binding protein
MTNQPVLLRVTALEKSYRRRPVLRAVDLHASPGEAVAIVGPNGAGKSTLLGCLSGERVPDRGSIAICGNDPFEDPREIAQCMGYVPEQPFLYDELTVAETLRFITEIRRLAPEATTKESGRLLELFGLAGAEHVLCRELSQGMARKVAIVAALLHRPRLIVLDEVFNGLDQLSSARLLEELDSRRAEGSAVLLSSHDLPLLSRWCDRGLLLTPHEWTDLSGEAWRLWKDEQGDLAPNR